MGSVAVCVVPRSLEASLSCREDGQAALGGELTAESLGRAGSGRPPAGSWATLTPPQKGFQDTSEAPGSAGEVLRSREGMGGLSLADVTWEEKPLRSERSTTREKAPAVVPHSEGATCQYPHSGTDESLGLPL